MAEVKRELATWTCHKVVKAGKIYSIIDDDPPGIDLIVGTSDGGKMKMRVNASVFARGMPTLGDYLVVYEDGYTSWSPAESFLGGYTLG